MRPPDFYSPFSPQKLLEKIPIKEARREYARLRSIAAKRVARLRSSQFAGADVTRRGSDLASIMTRDIKGTDIYLALKDISHWLGLKTSTVTGLKSAQAKSLETLHSHGYDFVNMSNIQDFGNYMDLVRTKVDARFLDSPRAAEMFDELSELDPEEIAEEFAAYTEEQRKRQKRIREIRGL